MHVADLVKEKDSSFTSGAIEHAYGEHGTREMQRFVVDSFRLDVDQNHLNEAVDELPGAFVRELCVAAMRSRKDPPSP